MSAERWVETSALGGQRLGWDPNAGTDQPRNLGKTVRPRVGVSVGARGGEDRVQGQGDRAQVSGVTLGFLGSCGGPPSRSLPWSSLGPSGLLEASPGERCVHVRLAVSALREWPPGPLSRPTDGAWAADVDAQSPGGWTPDQRCQLPLPSGRRGRTTPGAARAWCGRPPLCPHVVPVWPVPVPSSRELLPMSSYTDCHTALEPTQPDDLLLTSHVYSDPLQIRSCSEVLGFRTSEGSVQPITNTVFEASQT